MLDLCFIASRPLDDAITALKAKAVVIEQGPVARVGATGPIRSVDRRDSDLNLIEASEVLLA
ncbi:hypothetical protein [Zymobacter sp. IVIA_5232.4 C2]|uniref:hypothetical protein n=1 Tax=Zymobacter sp. IVIA_5232.4 C2 TaxID=3394855 RepID=UPI0039C1A595